jgi:hypothetical protein
MIRGVNRNGDLVVIERDIGRLPKRHADAFAGAATAGKADDRDLTHFAPP